VGTDVIVLNGGSSAGKSSMARCLQSVLPRPWLTLGIDDLLQAMPLPESGHDPGLTFEPTGAITVSPAFRPFEAAWFAGLSAMARAGVGVIVDEVFLGAGASQARLQSALADLSVLWVGVHCDAHVAAAREVGRPFHITGMAARQAKLVHDGVHYDVEVDTTARSALQCARIIAAHVIS
jgi:chloramphenicol 3-O phosphotransferase